MTASVPHQVGVGVENLAGSDGTIAFNRIVEGKETDQTMRRAERTFTLGHGHGIGEKHVGAGKKDFHVVSTAYESNAARIVAAPH